jgi:hypothetical protein
VLGFTDEVIAEHDGLLHRICRLMAQSGVLPLRIGVSRYWSEADIRRCTASTPRALITHLRHRWV